MVLQRAPDQANLWGFVDNCAPVTVYFNSTTISATVTPGSYIYLSLSAAYCTTVFSTDNGTVCRWRTILPATEPTATPVTITASSSSSAGNITLTDVLFGDVWVCSGQSNMQFTVPQVCPPLSPLLFLTSRCFRRIMLVKRRQGLIAIQTSVSSQRLSWPLTLPSKNFWQWSSLGVSPAPVRALPLFLFLSSQSLSHTRTHTRECWWR